MRTKARDRRVTPIVTRPDHKARPMTGEKVRDTTFLITRGGYDVATVDDLLCSIAAELDAGRPVEPLVRNAAFRTRRWRGYDVAAVDSFLGQLLLRPGPGELAEMSTDPWGDLDAVGGRFPRSGAGDRGGHSTWRSRQGRHLLHAEECWKAWHEFGQQPGTYLRLEWAGIARRELRSAGQQTIASMSCKWSDIWLTPDISEIGARFSINNESFVLKCTGYAQSRKLVDKTGTPILYTSGKNFERIAGASISFPDGRSLRFPVRGTYRANAIMTAVDEAGNSVARYRIIRFSTGGLGRKSVEVALHPGWELTNELMLAIMISAPQLRSYFSVQGGGG
jgi:DivIVA domain-containing protein